MTTQSRAGGRGAPRAAQRTVTQRERLMAALADEPELATGVARSMTRAFWSRTPLAAHADAAAIARGR